MAENDKKRYYWLKLKKDFFQSYKIKVLKALPNGRLYTLIYLELLAESTSHEGTLRFSDMLPYDINTLSAVIDEDRDNVEKAIEVLQNLELLEILSDKTIYLLDIQSMIGSETGVAERVRKYRENVKRLQCNTIETQVKPKGNLEYRDKSIEIREDDDKQIESQLEEKICLALARRLEARTINNADAKKLVRAFNEAFNVTGKEPSLSLIERVMDKIIDAQTFNDTGYIISSINNEVLYD